MKIKIATFLLMISLVNCNNYSENQKTKEINPIMTSMNKHADSLLLDPKINAISIGIYKDGKEYIGHYGELDKGKKNKPNNNTIYEIGSVSKTFTGTLVAQAELDGKLNLEDDIRKYLDGDYSNLEYNNQPIKIKHLITHTSRLPTFLPESINELLGNINESLPFNIYEIDKNYNKQKYYTDLHSVVLDTLPGTKYRYSNAGTELMAHILEKVYGNNYEALLKKHVFDIAKMPNTKIDLTDSEKKNLANGYGQTNKIVPHLIKPLWGAAGCVKSTIPDLINYMKFQLDTNNVVVQNSHKVIYQDGDDTIGFFWPIDTDEEDGTYYGHHGGSFGTQNFLFIMPKHNLGFSIITNQSGSQTAGKLIGVVGKVLDDLR